MKVRELIEVLQKLDPEAKVEIAWEEHVQYSELTGGSENRFENIERVYTWEAGETWPKEPTVALTCECYFGGTVVYPEQA